MTAPSPAEPGAPLPFDLLAGLPSGTTLLEASAGTGKTFTIAALATRYVAEGRATVDQLLMVTFGRSATRELRERVREALTRTRDALRDPETARSSSDPVIRSLAGLAGTERDAALERLTRATADFDSATIATTHQFCLNALAGLGVNADKDPGETFVEDIADLVEEVVDDLYVRKYARAHTDRLTLADARAIAATVVGEPQSELVAGPVAPGSPEETRVAFARAVAREVGERRRRRRLVTFDDLVLRLEAALTDPVTGDRACQRLRERYRVVLVDEFQDTDPAQWTILRRAFHGHRTLILIGDPKQAIYAFRGADVFSYLEAAGHADQHATLPTNHRSDEAVVRGLADLMGGLELGDARIVVTPVTAANARPRLVGLPTEARVRLRTWHPEDGELRVVGESRAAVAADVAADIVTLLTGPARLTGRGRPTTDDPAGRPVAPGDIAVLVSTHHQAAAVRGALVEAGVPVVVASASSVFATPAAEQWLTLLRAMEQPRPATIRAAALTDFLGHTAEELATAGEHVDSAVGLRLHTWAQVLDGSGVAALMAAMSQETDLAARVLTRPAGERHLTDLRHVASVLHREQRSRRAGLVGLAEWLTDRMRRAGERTREGTTDLTRRLETDAEAVQVHTVHASKGLEFPIVYVPYGWDRFDRTPEILSCHDASGRRVLDVRGARASGRADLEAAQRREEDGESLRLLYVSLTRASSNLVVHWASSKASTRTAPLHRVLCARGAGEPVAAPAYAVAGPPVGALAQSPWVVVEQVDQSPPRSRWAPPSGDRPALLAAPFSRAVDTTWRRTSYTGLTAAAHGPERAPADFRDDEPEGPSAAQAAQPVPTGPAEPDVRELRSAFAELPAGAAFGTLVHGILETIDTASADLLVEVRSRTADALSVHPMRGVDSPTLAAAIEPTLRTPLGPLAGGLRLADIPPGDRLAELDFELPMGGSSAATLAGLAGLVRQHVAAGEPLSGYPDHLAVPGLGTSTLRGYLSGSIDAVLRVPGPDGHRFLVVDYKTNLLRDPRAPRVEQLAWGYRPEVLPAAMISAHYPLQALLYSAALHRYLRWRLPGYDPERHLGGVLYLFLRGMAGPDTPTQNGIACGVFSWRPAPALIVALSDLLDGRWRMRTASELGPTRLELGPLEPFHAAGILGVPDVQVAAALMRIGGRPLPSAGASDAPVALGAALCVRALRAGSVCVDVSADPAEWTPEGADEGSAAAPAAVDPAAEGPVDLGPAALPWPDPDEWLASLRDHPLVAVGVEGPIDRPLRLVGELLYLTRYWLDEQLIRADLARRARLVAVDPFELAEGLARLFPDAGPDRQRLAAATAALRATTIIAGGPGTGKTTTVARLVALLRAVEGDHLTVALAAPTGKAAARLQEAILGEALKLDPADRERIGQPAASTLHRLLGWRPDAQGRFRHDRSNPLPHDVVIVDETSMVSLPLMARLLDAVRPEARLVLVGDPDQLASIDAGAVLGDLVHAPAPDPGSPGRSELVRAIAGASPLDAADVPAVSAAAAGLVVLDRNHRFGLGIGSLAEAIRRGDPDDVLAILTSRLPDVELVDLGPDVHQPPVRAMGAVRGDVVAQAELMVGAARAGDARTALEHLEGHRVLCAHREGPFGVGAWSELIAGWTEHLIDRPEPGSPWYVGRPLIVTSNDYAVGLYNGDTGVLIATPDGGRVAAFARGGEPVLIPPTRLDTVATLHAMTIHRGQGSQFDRATVVLPPADSPLLTRELLYTAVTRARSAIRIIGTQAAVRAAVLKQVRRASGLRQASS